MNTLVFNAGDYAMFNGQLGSIIVDGDQLKTSLFDKSFSLQPVSTDTFVPKANVAFGLLSIPIDPYPFDSKQYKGRMSPCWTDCPRLLRSNECRTPG